MLKWSGGCHAECKMREVCDIDKKAEYIKKNTHNKLTDVVLWSSGRFRMRNLWFDGVRQLWERNM